MTEKQYPYEENFYNVFEFAATAHMNSQQASMKAVTLLLDMFNNNPNFTNFGKLAYSDFKFIDCKVKKSASREDYLVTLSGWVTVSKVQK